ncbi:MAG: hypothetical protein V2B14_04570 [bacterium]
MNKDNLKEILENSRTNKTLFWQTLIVTIGGTIGLFLKALNTGTNLFEILLIIIGFILSFFLLRIVLNINEIMNKIIKKMNEGGK